MLYQAAISFTDLLSLLPMLIIFIKMDFQIRQGYGFLLLPELISHGFPGPRAASFS